MIETTAVQAANVSPVFHARGLSKTYRMGDVEVHALRLAERLGVVAGEVITVEAMEGRRQKRDLPISASVDEMVGMASYMEIDTLNRFTGEGAVVSAATMYIEPTAMLDLAQWLKTRE